MAIRLVEFFGYPVGAAEGLEFARRLQCPFTATDCIKPDHGACSLAALRSPEPVICCPHRLYADECRILKDVADIAFAGDFEIITPDEIRHRTLSRSLSGSEVVAFGKRFGQELPLPKAGKTGGSFYMDWVLVRPDIHGRPAEMTALEVQTVDTTGNYREQSDEAFEGRIFTDSSGRTPGFSESNFNWENVNKRILSQVIYKGHVLRRERLCTKGLFFACPQPVLDRIMNRIGGIDGLHEYPLQPGAITFLAYNVGEERGWQQRLLTGPTAFTTTIDQIALAFTAPRNLPDAGVYELAANIALR